MALSAVCDCGISFLVILTYFFKQTYIPGRTDTVWELTKQLNIYTIRSTKQVTQNKLTHTKPFCGTKGNSADPDQTPQNVASDQGLQCLLA